MSKREKNVGRVSPKGVTQRNDGSAHGDVGLRPSMVSVSNYEAANPTYGTELCALFDESAKLEKAIKTNLKGLLRCE